MTIEMLTIEKEIGAYEKCRALFLEATMGENADPTVVRHVAEDLLMLARSADHMSVRRLALDAVRPRPECDATIKAVLHEAIFSTCEDLMEDSHGLTNP